LNVIHLVLAPLRSRREDIEPLLRHFVEKFCEQYRLAPPEISREALDALMSYDWPGNVRELKNVVERFIVRGRGDIILPQDLPSVNLATRPMATPPAGSATLGFVATDRRAPPCRPDSSIGSSIAESRSGQPSTNRS
jgi:DNA-binding NtrC family response regulator